MRKASNPHQPRKALGRDLFVAFLCCAFVTLTAGLSYAALPLYSWFCRTAGFEHTAQAVMTPPPREAARLVDVRFDANLSDTNLADDLPWSFRPGRNTINVRFGQIAILSYKVADDADRVIIVQAGYDVSPRFVGGYVETIDCFCLTRPTLQVGGSRDMAVLPTAERALRPAAIETAGSRSRI